MKKYLFLTLTIWLFLSAFINFSFAAGKVTPINWDTPANPDELEGVAIPTQPENAESPLIVMTEKNGDLQVLRSDGIWTVVPAGSDLKNGDQIKTTSYSAYMSFVGDAESRVEIGLSTGFTFFGISPNISFKGDDSGVPDIGLELSIGWLRIKINHLFHKVRVKTPSATITDKGTDFIVWYDPDTKITNVYLYEGLLDVDNLHGKTIELQPGDTVAVDGDGKMTLGKLSEEQWTQLTNEISPPETPAAKPSNMLGWAGAIAMLLIGAGALIYYRTRKHGLRT